MAKCNQLAFLPFKGLIVVLASASVAKLSPKRRPLGTILSRNASYVLHCSACLSGLAADPLPARTPPPNWSILRPPEQLIMRTLNIVPSANKKVLQYAPFSRRFRFEFVYINYEITVYNH